MTDRHSGYVVTLNKDLREDDAEATLNALRQIRGVLTVTPVVSIPAVHIAEERVRTEFAMRAQRMVGDLLRAGASEHGA